MKPIALGFALALALSGAALAKDPVGEWHGVVISPVVGPLRIGIQLKAGPAGGYVGDLTSPDQTPAAFPIADAKLEGDTLSFAVPAVNASYKGVWTEAERKWKGQLTQGLAIPLDFEAGPPPPKP
jgi:hypothetical protein